MSERPSPYSMLSFIHMSAAQVKIWIIWRDVVKVAQKNRSAWHSSLVSLQWSAIGRLFRAWHDVAMRTAASHRVASKFIKRLQHVTLSRTLAAWIDFALQRRFIRLAAHHNTYLSSQVRDTIAVGKYNHNKHC